MKTKILLITLAAMLTAGNNFAQWTGGSNNPIYNVNLTDNVGIGTSAPANNLEVQGTTAIIGINAITNISTPSTGNPAIIYRIDGTLKFAHGIDHSNNDDFKIMRSGQNVCMTILQSNGNVGIGTQTPANLLEVTGGDINAQTATNGYKVNNAFMLWHNNKSGCSYIGGAGSSNNVGINNTLVGKDAGLNNTYAKDNTALGYQALNAQSWANGNTEWSTFNTAIGTQALFSNQPTTTSNGAYNTAVGNKALKDNSTGYWNTACGSGALLYNTSGYANTAVGLNAANACTTSVYTTAIGANALKLLKNGDENTALGYSALYYNVIGDYNTAVGVAALSLTTGDNNTAVGRNAGYNITSNNNTAIGYGAGNNVTSGGNNTFLGYGADATTSTWSNCTAIGNGASVTNNGDFVLGDASITALRCAKTLSGLSDRRVKNTIKENVPGLAFINLLKPVTYHLDVHRINSIQGYRMKRDSAGNSTNEVDTTYWVGKYNNEEVLFTGFIAQQVDSAAKQIGYDFSGVDRPQDSSKSLYALRYSEFVVPLVKAVQELSKKADSLQAAIDSLTTPKSERKAGQNNDSLGQKVAQLEELIKQCCTMENAIPTGENTNSSNSDDNKQNVKLTLLEKPTLGEAQPNPNNGSTVIPYYLPENSVNAKMVFVDMLGRIMKEETLKIGYGSLNVETQDLPSGMYSFTLVVDGKEVDNKKMIRNK